jgi:hypothetical protein
MPRTDRQLDTARPDRSLERKKARQKGAKSPATPATKKETTKQ